MCLPGLHKALFPVQTLWQATQITRFMGPTWGPPGSCRPQMGPMLAPWTLLLGYRCINESATRNMRNDALRDGWPIGWVHPWNIMLGSGYGNDLCTTSHRSQMDSILFGLSRESRELNILFIYAYTHDTWHLRIVSKPSLRPRKFIDVIVRQKPLSFEGWQ